MNIKEFFTRKHYSLRDDDNRPVKSIEIGPNMWMLVYADEPVKEN
ncbi:MAG: hypothetical protein ACP5TL_03020 [Candidatus Micrarchaeia archaeon]